MRRLLNQIEKFWCVAVHNDVMWPFRGRYRCRVCNREYVVGFELVNPEAHSG